MKVVDSDNDFKAEIKDIFYFMNRKVQGVIKKYDNEQGKRLIVLWGMKGTGKTYSVLEHVKKTYEEYLYIDAHGDLRFRKACTKSRESGLEELMTGFFGIDEEYLVNIPIIIDEPEIEMVKTLFSSYSKRLKLFVITSDKCIAETILGLTGEDAGKCLSKGPETDGSFYAFIHMIPMNFGDFLIAMGKEWYEEVITGHLLSKRKLPGMIHEELLDLYDLYLQTGGMPEIVAEYLEFGSVENVRERQRLLNIALRGMIYDEDDTKAVRTKGFLEAVEKVLEKDNHKFMYSAIRDGVSRKDYEDVLSNLESKEFLIKIPRLNSKKDDFRLYLADTCLYGHNGRKTESEYNTANTDDSIQNDMNSEDSYEENEVNRKNAAWKIMESAVLQNVVSSGIKTYYWETGAGAGLDCVIEKDGRYVPVDIHMLGKGRSRSLGAFKKDYGCDFSLKLTEENCRFEEKTILLPIYAAYGLNLMNFT